MSYNSWSRSREGRFAEPVGPPSRRRRSASPWRWARAAAVLVATVWLGGCGYGRIHELDEQVVAARDEIEVQLQRRVELVPGLIETVAEYGVARGSAVEAVLGARLRLAAAVRSGDLAAMEAADADLCRALDDLLAATEGHRALEQDAAFELLRSRLKLTEVETLRASRRYNAAVRRYNAYITGFPQVLTARVIGAERRERFEPAVMAAAGLPSVDE